MAIAMIAAARRRLGSSRIREKAPQIRVAAT
jgi:hypothetical protein